MSNNFIVPEDSYCGLCRRNHPLRKCRRFLSMPYDTKLDFIERERICRNCLGTTHTVRYCPSKDYCHKCQRSHNTILHYSDEDSHSVQLEMTAMVYLAEFTNEEGVLWRIRLDPSQAYSSIAAWSIYKIRTLTNFKLCPETVLVYLWSRFDGGERHKVQANLKVVDRPMEKTPKLLLKRDNILRRVNKISVADVHFWNPDYAPITLGSDLATNIYIGAPKTNPMLPMSQCTIFGWTFFGHVKKADIKEERDKKKKK
ncbi:uncharacterized protein LOC109612299 [Musca domestica]|uniref:Uncharacterized protein LOC109612299 n=1 Tax=Musca domestica TaxID=7370 RepID=A0A9J7DGU6_MUSDO|nr:uncharacterized protein LOC109612299 [Musca domestica]